MEAGSVSSARFHPNSTEINFVRRGLGGKEEGRREKTAEEEPQGNRLGMVSPLPHVGK